MGLTIASSTPTVPIEPSSVSDETEEITNLPDGSVKVCYCRPGFRVCGFVSSMHLVEPKLNQLKNAWLFGSAFNEEPYDDDLADAC